MNSNWAKSLMLMPMWMTTFFVSLVLALMLKMNLHFCQGGHDFGHDARAVVGDDFHVDFKAFIPS